MRPPIATVSHGNACSCRWRVATPIVLDGTGLPMVTRFRAAAGDGEEHVFQLSMSIMKDATSDLTSESASMSPNSPPRSIRRFIIIYYKLGTKDNCVPIDLGTISGREHNITVGKLQPDYQARRFTDSKADLAGAIRRGRDDNESAVPLSHRGTREVRPQRPRDARRHLPNQLPASTQSG